MGGPGSGRKKGSGSSIKRVARKNDYMAGIRNSLGITGRIKWKNITKMQATKAIGSSLGMPKAMYNKLRQKELGH